MDIPAHNRAAWDQKVEQQDRWTRPVTKEVIERARRGEFELLLTAAVHHEPTVVTEALQASPRAAIKVGGVTPLAQEPRRLPCFATSARCSPSLS
jgi:hypothetical protein